MAQQNKIPKWKKFKNNGLAKPRLKRHLAPGKPALIWRKHTLRLLKEKAESEGMCLLAYCRYIAFEHHFLLKGPDTCLTTYATSLACLLGKDVLAVPDGYSDPNTCCRCLQEIEPQKPRKLRVGKPAYVWRDRVIQGIEFKAKQAGLTPQNYCYRIGFYMGMNKSNQPTLLTRYSNALSKLLGEQILVQSDRKPAQTVCAKCQSKGLTTLGVVAVYQSPEPMTTLQPVINVEEVAVKTESVKPKPVPKAKPEPAKEAPAMPANLSPFQLMVYRGKLELEKQSAEIKRKRSQELKDLAREADLQSDRRRNRGKKMA